MNVYVETNFVLELALRQEQAESCDAILLLCETGRARLVVPASAIAEAAATLSQRGARRQDMKRALDKELNQLARTAIYSERLLGFQEITTLLIEGSAAAVASLAETRVRILRVAEIVPLDVDILNAADTYRNAYGLRPPDAFVLASILGHLGDKPVAASVFLNRDSDFDSPEIVDELSHRRCKLFGNFDRGLAALRGGSLAAP